MTTVADLSPQQKTDLYAQVGDAMNNPGFNYDAHVTANTVNGVFVAPVNNPPAGTTGTTTTTVTTSPATTGSVNGTTASATTSTIAGLSQTQLTALYAQVGDAMYAPGFNYAAHISANTVNGVFVAPVFIPANTSTLLTMPTVGSAAYQKLLTETGGASANAGFNYAAHVAATVSQGRVDLSYDDVMRIIVETGKTDFTNFDLAAYRASTGSKVGLGNEFSNTTAAAVAANQLQQSVILKMPAVGSSEYQALSLETGGASENPGFNYVAHVAAITSQKVLTSLSYAEVVTLIAETGKSNFTNFDLASYQKEKVSADLLINRFVADPTKTATAAPAVGTAEYQAILKDTGLKDLAGFDYGAYLGAKREAQLALSTLQGSAGDDVIIAAPSDAKTIFVAGQGNDKITASTAADILIGGAGDDVLDGASGIDKAVFTGKVSDYKISRSTDRVDVADSQSSRDGADSLKNIERLSFSDTALALDTAANQNAGSVYMLYQATFNRKPDASGIGYWIDRVDNGADITKDVATFFTTSSEFISKYGANPSNSSYVDNLYKNVLGRTGEASGVKYWNQELDAGRITKAQVLENFATLAEGAALVAPDITNGIVYTQWVG